MEQKIERKKYEIQGKTYSLAICSPKRMGHYCRLMDIKDFNDLKKEGIEVELGARLMNLTLETEKIKEILKLCLAETPDPAIDYDEIDLVIVDQMFNDFFYQRVRK